MRGGYQLLNLKGLALTSGDAANVKGAYDQINRSNGKRVVVTGLNVGDTAYNDFEAYFTAGENTFEAAATLGAVNMTISVDYGDDVTVTVAEPESGD